MTFQPAAQTFQSASAPLHGGFDEPRSFQDLLADAHRMPPTDLAQAHAVIARLARMADAQAVVVPAEARGVPDFDNGGLAVWKARRIRAHIEERLAGAISNRELAQLANLSVSYFCRAFKKTFGETAHLYIVRRRVALAQKLMRESGDVLADIALACGFADQAHMTRIFTKLVGASPARWRRAHGPILQSSVLQ